ncbi:MAG: SIS domain-containing protein [bacterium]
MGKNPLTALGDLFLSIEVTDREQKVINFVNAVSSVSKTILKRAKQGNKIIIIGNGGSASIASHMATDFLKNIKIPALAFTDASLLTCLSNDLGYENVFSAPIGILADKGDVLFAISSSGKSKNILNAVSMARKKGCFIAGLSGFSPDNPLREMGDINFYLPSSSYGDVEVTHMAICHAVIDILYKEQEKRG